MTCVEWRLRCYLVLNTKCLHLIVMLTNLIFSDRWLSVEWKSEYNAHRPIYYPQILSRWILHFTLYVHFFPLSIDSIDLHLFLHPPYKFLHVLQVALKTLIVIHRTLREGDPTFREELLNFTQRARILQLSNFKDDSSPIGKIFETLFSVWFIKMILIHISFS